MHSNQEIDGISKRSVCLNRLSTFNGITVFSCNACRKVHHNHIYKPIEKGKPL